MAELGRVLIADDEETFLYSTAELFRRQGYDCECAKDADSAAEMLSAGAYDVLIADIRMPGNSDLELIRNLGTRTKALPVILVTGYPSLKTAVQSIKLPVVAYLVKPLDFDELLKNVQHTVENFRMLECDFKCKQAL